MSSSLVPIHTQDDSITTASNGNNKIDFITSADAVKDIFMLPYYDSDRPVSVAIHNVEGTLILEDANHTVPDTMLTSSQTPPFENEHPANEDQHQLIQTSVSSAILLENNEGSSSRDNSNNSNHEALTIVNTVLSQQKNQPSQQTQQQEEPAYDLRSWTFRDMNLLVGSSNALVYGTSATIRLEEASHLQAMAKQHQTKRDRKVSYAEVASKPSQQTCIVPAVAPTNPLGGNLICTNERPAPVSPVTTVLDTYLDNIMANVPQLALCLQEKGFIRSIKLMETKHIPSRLLDARTVDTSIPFETIREDDPAEQIFTPEIMEMNAHALLRFLQTNCAKDNATYLLQRDAGCSNVQLFDISSAQPQWIWRLAMMSYRFANRLRNLGDDNAQRRTFRARQRSLLQNTLDLLEMLGDMKGKRHESLMASVNENLADTFLVGGIDEEEERAEVKPSQAETPIAPPPLALSVGQPYATVSVDSLGKAQTHLTYGIKILRSLLDSKLKRKKRHKRQSSDLVESVGESSDDEDLGEDDKTIDEISPAAIQLVGMQKKTIDVTLCVAMEDLKLYWTSSAMHNLRKASHLIVETLDLITLTKEDTSWLKQVRQQYGWMWEMCGHFARSFASDEKWRDQGHSSGDDVLGILQDMEALFDGRTDIVGESQTFEKRFDLSMQELSGIVNFECPRQRILSDKESKVWKMKALDHARDRLGKQTTIQRERRRVLVGSCLAYDRALSVLDDIQNFTTGEDHPVYTLQQRLGDACNETGKALLNELRALIAYCGKANVEQAFVAETICSSAEYWLLRGLQSFSLCKDARNLALLHCNLCQCYKLRANSIFGHIIVLKKKRESPHDEDCLESAASHLQEAHSVLEERHSDPVTWDMVSIELAATYLVLGVRRRQRLVGTTNVAALSMPSTQTISPGEEKGIVEPIQKAIGIYESLGNITQSAAANYQLALFFSKVWTRQRDESKSSEKLAAAFQLFQTAHTLFSQVLEGNEVNFCLVALDLAAFYASLSAEMALKKALCVCLDTSRALSFDLVVRMNAELVGRETGLKELNAICSSVDEQTFDLLKRLIKVDSKQSGSYKALYRAGLTAKTGRVPPDDLGLGHEAAEETAKILLSLRRILDAVHEAWEKEGMES